MNSTAATVDIVKAFISEFYFQLIWLFSVSLILKNRERLMDSIILKLKNDPDNNSLQVDLQWWCVCMRAHSPEIYSLKTLIDYLLFMNICVIVIYVKFIVLKLSKINIL